MLKTLHIKNFRLFQDLKLDSLNRVNLITGVNNSGKTALLEALVFVLAGVGRLFDFPSALRSSFAIDQIRGRAPVFGDEFENFWMWLFNQKDLRRPIEIEALGTRGTYLVKLNQQGLRSSSAFGFDYFRNGMKVSSSTVSRGDGYSASIEVADSEWPKLITFSTNPSSPTEDAEYFNRIAA